MRYAVIDGSDVFIIARSEAEAERECKFVSDRYGRNNVRTVTIGDNPDETGRLHRQLSIRNARDEE